LRKLAAQHPELVVTYVEDVQKSGSMPSWLTGVPTVVRLSDYEVTQGTQGIERVRDWAASRPSAAPAGAARGAAASGGVRLQDLGENDGPASVEDAAPRSLEEHLREREARRPLSATPPLELTSLEAASVVPAPLEHTFRVTGAAS
jgi:hypothetical protein